MLTITALEYYFVTEKGYSAEFDHITFNNLVTGYEIYQKEHNKPLFNNI